MGRSRRKWKNKTPRRGLPARALRAVAVLTVLAYVAHPTIHRALRAADERHLPLIALGLAVLMLGWRLRRALAKRRRIRELIVSDRRRDYLIDDEDYRRGIAKEASYRRVMQLSLLAAFDNRCAKCHRRDDGVDLDHFFLPKVAGGCFIMRHHAGFLVNNAIPLCVHCNRSKSARSYRSFFTAAELIPILEKNQRMTELLNEREPLDQRGGAKPRRRPVRAA